MVRVGFILRVSVSVLLVTCLVDGSRNTGLVVTAVALLVLLLNFSSPYTISPFQLSTFAFLLTYLVRNPPVITNLPFVTSLDVLQSSSSEPATILAGSVKQISIIAPSSTTTTTMSSTLITSTLAPTSSSTTTLSTTTALSCVVGYILDNTYNLCYQWYLAPTKYEDAKATCRNEGASLLLVDNLEMQKFGANLIQSNPSAGVMFIQGKRNPLKPWYDDAGNEMSYFNWDVDEPDFYDNVLLLVSSGYIRGTAGERLPFTCVYDPAGR